MFHPVLVFSTSDTPPEDSLRVSTRDSKRTTAPLPRLPDVLPNGRIRSRFVRQSDRRRDRKDLGTVL